MTSYIISQRIRPIPNEIVSKKMEYMNDIWIIAKSIKSRSVRKDLHLLAGAQDKSEVH